MTLNERVALVLAHPGHELRVYGWLQKMQPLVFIFTDGSGSSGVSRLDSTTKILDQADAPIGSIYGRFTDRAIYSAILNHDTKFFTDLAEELAQSLVREQITLVAGDATEGYNPTHDVCRLVTDAAVARAYALSGQRPKNFEFLLIGPPDSCPPHLHEQAMCLQMDDTMLERKITAAREYSELSGEVVAALQRAEGVEAFRTEYLLPVAGHNASDTAPQEAPFYETYGEQQVAAGRYKYVIRYQEHIAPLAAELRRYAGS